MKTVKLEQATLELCMQDIQFERVVITRAGKPIALIVNIEGMDEEQLQLGSSRKFWKLVDGWRKEKTITRAVLEKKLARTDKLRAKKRSGSLAQKPKRATLLHR